MANKIDNVENDFVNGLQHKKNSSSLSFLHQQNMDCIPVKTVDASNLSSPPQASSTAETPLSPPSQVMTSSDKIKATPIHEFGGSTQGNNPTNSQNSNSLAHHNNTTNIINNNHSQNTENYKNDALNKPGRYQEDENRLQPHLGTPINNSALSKRSPSHESHFSGGSGVLSDAPPARSARKQYVSKSRSELNNILKEREERVKRVRHEQEAERLKKADEWKQQALTAHKFREQQEFERRRALEDARNREIAKQNQIKERREKIIEAERERRDELLKRNMAREERLEQRRKSHASQIQFGFGSSTPRMIEAKTDDGYRRSTSSTNVHGQLMTQSMYVPSRRSADRDSNDGSSSVTTRHPVSTSEKSNKRSTSVYGLDKSGKEGNDGADLMTQSFHAGAATSSHARVLPNRRRTDLTPTVTAIDSGLGQPLSSREISRASTPGRRMLLSSTNGKSPGKAVSMSRLDQLARPRVLNLNKSQYTSPDEVSPSHAPISLNNNARLNHRRSRVGQTPSKNISASMSQLNTQTKDTTTAPRLRDRPRPPLSASSATRTRSKIGDKGVEGMSREGTIRSPSAMSAASHAGTSVQVRLRNPGMQRKPRPTSIAVSGMSQSMYDKRTASSAASTPSSYRGPPRLQTPDTKKKGPGSVGRGGGLDDPNEDAKSNASSSSSNKHPTSRTPKQVKAADAKKTKPNKTPLPSSLSVSTSTPNRKPSVVSSNKPNCKTEESSKGLKDPDHLDSDGGNGEIQKQTRKREITPDIISGAVIQKSNDDMQPQVMVDDEISSQKHISEKDDKVTNELHDADIIAIEEKRPTESNDNETKEESKVEDHSIHENSPAKHIITSEVEAKARIAEKRREMKEKMEREAELERQRLAEIERLEEEKRLKEEEEERKAMEEAEKLAAEARKAEEERLQRAIEEAQKREVEERTKREEEERVKKDTEQKAKEEAERKQAELEEKLKKEEEERLARKKRIEEIMARTRGGNKASTASPAGTPKKEHANKSDNDSDSNDNNNVNESTNISKENGKEGLFHTNDIINGQDGNTSMVNNGPPDLLGDISSNQHEGAVLSTTDTQNDLLQSNHEEKIMNEKNSSNTKIPQQHQPLLDFGTGDFDPFENKLNINTAAISSSVLGSDQPVLDQIIDLSNEPSSMDPKTAMMVTKNNHTLSSADHKNIQGVLDVNDSVIGAPIIAFEDSITASTKSDVPTTADLLS